MDRIGDPADDIAPVVIFFGSEDSHWITGQNINVDEGQPECVHVEKNQIK